MYLEILIAIIGKEKLDHDDAKLTTTHIRENKYLPANSIFRYLILTIDKQASNNA